MDESITDRAQYAAAVAAETRRYESCHHVHDLPAIFHYWSHTYIHPQLTALGFSGPDDLFERELRRICAAGQGAPRFLSLGSGNCDLEVRIAAKLRGEGFADFTIDCFDLNPAMLARGRRAAEQAGVAANAGFLEGDLNQWRAETEYDAVIANQSLHHIVNLEGVFAEVKRCLRPGGVLVTSDMIGRNGHRRWPEALELAYEFWRKLPPSYRFNRQSGYYEELYEDRDYSDEGFEGVRAQDILALLLEHFHFRTFFGFANAIDAFVDRGFGPNFDVSAEWDRRFIDELHRRDESEIAAGRLTPTHMLAVLTKEPGEFTGNLQPQKCVRPVNGAVAEARVPESAYDDFAWPHDVRAELAAVRAKLAELTKLVQRQADSVEAFRLSSDWVAEMKGELERRAAWARHMEEAFNDRTAWALRLEANIADRTEWARRMETQADERTEWALRLDRELKDAQKELDARAAWAMELQRNFESRTAWAMQLQEEVREQTERAEAAEAEVRKLVRQPWRLFGKIASGLRKRLRSG